MGAWLEGVILLLVSILMAILKSPLRMPLETVFRVICWGLWVQE